MVYTVTLNPAVDYDVFFDSVNKGALNVAKSANFRAAGKGINVSKLLHNMGVNTKALGFLAGFTGDFIRDDLNKSGIEHHFVNVPGITRINVKLLESDVETELNGVPAPVTSHNIDEIKQILSRTKSGDYVVFSGSIAKGVASTIYKDLVEYLDKNVKTVLDTRGDLLLCNMSDQFLIKPNISELEEMSGRSLKNDSEVVTAAKNFVDAGIKNVIVSKGGEGAVFVSESECYTAKVPKGKVVKTIAAGDSMVAAFIYADINGMSRKDSFRYAVAAGSATAFSETIAKHEKINELYEVVEAVSII